MQTGMRFGSLPESSYCIRGQSDAVQLYAWRSPMLADGVSPSPPMRPAHRSEMISPYKLGITCRHLDAFEAEI